MPFPKPVRDELEKILASSEFANSPRMRRFLEFVVDETLNRRATQIKEYAIALEVFGKRPDYDPRTDSTVRTEATKLRARLDRYYATEGISDPLVISLPRGGYVPSFREVAAVSAPIVLVTAQPSSRRWFRSALFLNAAAALLLLAVVACVWTFSWVRRERKLLQLEAKASVLMDSWSSAEIRKGIEYYRQVVSLNPHSAEGYAGMASGYVLLSDLFMDPREAMPKAAVAATRAIELNRGLSEPHISLGLVKLEFEWDWGGAEKEFTTAIEMSPHEPLPHHLYGWYLMAAGRLPEARAELERAVALDPSDDMGYWELGLVYYFGHRYEDAAEQERRAIALQPKNYLQHMFLGWALEQQGRYDEAIAEITTARRFTEGSQVVASLAGC